MMKLIQLKNLSEKQRNDYMEYYNNVLLSGKLGVKILEPYDNFDSSGLKFPISYLENIARQVIFFPLEIMSKYACEGLILNISKDDKQYIEGLKENVEIVNSKPFKIHEFFELNSDEIKNSPVYNRIDAVVIGNMAYVVLNCKDSECVANYSKILSKIFDIESGAITLGFRNYLRMVNLKTR